MRVCRILALYMSAALSITSNLALGSTEEAITSPGLLKGKYKTFKNLRDTESSVMHDNEDRMLSTSRAASIVNNGLSHLSEDQNKIISTMISEKKKVTSTGNAHVDPAFVEHLRLLYKEGDMVQVIKAASDPTLPSPTAVFRSWFNASKHPDQVQKDLQHFLKADERKHIPTIVANYKTFYDKPGLKFSPLLDTFLARMYGTKAVEKLSKVHGRIRA